MSKKAFHVAGQRKKNALRYREMVKRRETCLSKERQLEERECQVGNQTMETKVFFSAYDEESHW